MPVDWPTIGIVASIIGGSVSITLYIARGFRNLETAFYKALDVHKKEDGEKFEMISHRLQRVEIKSFGFGGAENP